MKSKLIFTKNKGQLLASLVLIALFSYLHIPTFFKNTENEGKKIISRPYAVFNKSEIMTFPFENSNSVAIFWASWCAPCKLEMARLKSSVEAGKIPKENIFAINPFENRVEILKFINQNSYPFAFIEAPELSSELQIDRTPTILLFEKDKIKSISSGISLLTVWKAEWLFK